MGKLADFFIELRPDVSGFKREADLKLAAETRGLDATAKIKIDQRSAREFTSTMATLGKATDSAASDAADFGGTLGKLSNYGIPALVGGVVALAPVIATLGVGFGGLGLAALGVIKNQRLMAQTIAPLKAEYTSFQRSLQPVILRDFAGGIKLASHLMADAQPVAQATGKAFGVMLGAVDREFRSGTWQQFFGWMARQVGPDMRLLTTDVLQLAHALPTILTSLQPIATGSLSTIARVETLTGDIAKLTSNLLTLNHAVPKQGTGSSNPLRFLSDQSIIHGLKFINDLLPRFLQHAAEGAGAIKKTGDDAHGAGPKMSAYGMKLDLTAQNAATAATRIGAMKAAVNALTTSMSNSLTTQLAYSNALITSKNDAVNFRTALAASKGMVGLHTAAQRASFSAANQYIADLVQVAAKSWASGRGTDGASTAIRNALPLLESVRTKNRLYWQELRTLKSWLDKLAKEKLIHESIVMTGSGKWSWAVQGSGVRGTSPAGGVGPGRGPHQAAAGWLVRGGIPGRDSVLAALTPGELVVPTPLVNAGAVDHLRGAIPGFAAGGLVPDHSGNVKGLVPWSKADIAATQAKMRDSFAAAMWANHPVLSAFGGPSGGGSYGVGRWAGLILQVLRLLGQSPAWLSTVERRMNQESGGNPNAINLWDSNARAGTPSEGLMQVIGPTFAAYAGPYWARGIFDPFANIYAGLNYALHRYGSLSALNRPGGYDRGGTITEPMLAVGASGRNYLFHQGESVTPESTVRKQQATLDRIERHMRTLIGVTADTPNGFAKALNGAASRAVAR